MELVWIFSPRYDAKVGVGRGFYMRYPGTLHDVPGHHLFPYAKATPVPSGADPVMDVILDPELGNEGFPYRLPSGREGSVHIDSVREVSHEPKYIANLLLYQLSVEAQRRMESSGETAHQVADALNTSPAQLYRLLYPTNYTKFFRQLVSLLNHLGLNVDFQLSETASR